MESYLGEMIARLGEVAQIKFNSTMPTILNWEVEPKEISSGIGVNPQK